MACFDCLMFQKECKAQIVAKAVIANQQSDSCLNPWIVPSCLSRLLLSSTVATWSFPR